MVQGGVIDLKVFSLSRKRGHKRKESLGGGNFEKANPNPLLKYFHVFSMYSVIAPKHSLVLVNCKSFLLFTVIKSWETLYLHSSRLCLMACSCQYQLLFFLFAERICTLCTIWAIYQGYTEGPWPFIIYCILNTIDIVRITLCMLL